MQKTSEVLRASPALPRDVQSLRNWLGSNGCIFSPEASYLQHDADLIRLSSPGDTATRLVETWAEDQLIRHYKQFRKVPSRRIHASKSKRLTRDIACGQCLIERPRSLSLFRNPRQERNKYIGPARCR
jgi:hypothetical protein